MEVPGATAPLKLRWLTGSCGESLVVVRIGAGTACPDWVVAGLAHRVTAEDPLAQIFSVTRTPKELSVVCAEQRLPVSWRSEPPAGVIIETDWTGFCVEGPLDFSLVGIMGAIASRLTSVGVSLFAMSTYDTDYVLVKREHARKAACAMTANLDQVGSGVSGSAAGCEISFCWTNVWATS